MLFRFTAALLLTALGTPHTASAQDRLPLAVVQAMQTLGLPADALAAVALPLGHRSPVWQHQASLPFQPGSSMKVVTSIVALDRLGPNHRGFTALRSAAPLSAATLQGDLVLQGGGDVELGPSQLWSLLVDLRQAGVRHIAGDLLVDRTRYQPARLDIGLPPFDNSTEFAYNVIPDALMLNEGLLPLELRATDSGVSAATVPPIQGIVFDSSRMALVDARCADWDDHWQPAITTRSADGQTRVTLNGAFPRGCTQRTRLQLVDRADLTDKLFRSLWQGLGGTWAGRAREAATPADVPANTRQLARRQGRPWAELLRHLNKFSDNAWTRVLYLELGVPLMASQPNKTTQELADAAVRQWLAQQGLDDAGLVLDNGSGLSRTERISPLLLAQMLKVAHAGKNAPELLMSLPTVAVDGTMRNRLKDSPAAGWARLKTGTLRNVVALAGYVKDVDGRPWVLVAMVNHDTLASRSRPVLDALVDHIARHGLQTQLSAPGMGVGPQGDGP